MRREGPGGKTEKELPENSECDIIKAQKRKGFKEMVLNDAESSNKM